jgi:dipeptidyl aminopeptidase/acylaminoacyl peptidase
MDARSGDDLVRADLVRALLSARSTVLADIDRSSAAAQRLLVRSDASGTFQLSELCDGTLTPLTDLPEPVSGGHYVPRTRRAVLEIDAGGNERGQLFELELDRVAPVTSFSQLRALTDDPRHGHHYAGISPDGSVLAYTSNHDGGVNFDVYLCDLATGAHRQLWRSGGWAHPASGFSPDGRYLSVLVPGTRPLDMRLVLIQVIADDGVTGVSVTSTPGRASLFGPPAWIRPDACLMSSNADGDLSAIVRRDLVADGDLRLTPIVGTGERYDADVIASADGGTAVAVENRDGAGVMRVIDLGADALGPEILTPEAGMIDPILSPDGSTVYYTLSAPRIPGDVFATELRTGHTRRLTESPTQIPSPQLVVPELGRIESFDGETVPYFIYRPREPASEPSPVVVFVHGGPEFQATRLHSPVIQALVAVGYAVVVPNVRGSTGYGKRYAGLDDTTRRLDAVRDLAAVHGRLAALGCDPGRAVLWGGSYGGYMVLAGLAFQPELWAAGVDIVGIASLVTFLENTSPYRRAHREREYGSLEHDRAFLAEASPLTHVDMMRAPLFVIHGRNDPRVPVAEAERLAASLRARDVRCELRIYEDEGHGLARLANRLDAFPRAIAFLDERLGRV